MRRRPDPPDPGARAGTEPDGGAGWQGAGAPAWVAGPAGAGPASALSEDRFLGGRLAILQPRRGYRAATDPLFLAAAVPAVAGQRILELGCGAGVASLALGVRVPGLGLTGVELQADYAALARRNAAANCLPLGVVVADLRVLPAALRRTGYDHVIANPPWFAPAAPAARDSGRDMAQRESLPLGLWVDIGLRRLRPGGRMTLIQRAERLPEILCAAEARAAALVLPLAARAGRSAGRILVQLHKGSAAPFRLLAPFVVHHGERHLRDAPDWSARARAVLHDAAALPMTDPAP